MENRTGSETVRIALDTNWGGTIVQLSIDGTEFVNRHDTGREVQPAFYDGNGQGWDPVLGGDKYNHGSPTLIGRLTRASLFTRTRPLQWNPDLFGGGPGRSILSDVIVDQTVTAVAGYPRAFRVQWKLVHEGKDLHTNAHQEIPAVYANMEFDRFVCYSGIAPWTHGAITEIEVPLFAAIPQTYVPERWSAFVDSSGSGLTIYEPGQYPWVTGANFSAPYDAGGPSGNGTMYFSPSNALTIGPRFVTTGDFYLIAGDYRSARDAIYRLHRTRAARHVFPPYGFDDYPADGSVISASTELGGWTFDDGKVAQVAVLVDGKVAGVAKYGIPRPDVATVFPNAPVNVGFSYQLNTSKYRDGTHLVNIRVKDRNGRVAIFPDRNLIFDNASDESGPNPLAAVPKESNRVQRDGSD